MNIFFNSEVFYDQRQIRCKNNGGGTFGTKVRDAEKRGEALVTVLKIHRL